MSKQQKQSMKSKLPKEAVMFAKTMGLSLDGKCKSSYYDHWYKWSMIIDALISDMHVYNML